MAFIKEAQIMQRQSYHQWFQEAGYGMMAHFGLYSLLPRYSPARRDYRPKWAIMP